MSRPPFDLSVYLVTDTAQCADLGVPRTVAEAVAAGVTLVQVRDPDADDAAFLALAREVAAVLSGTGVPLVLDDRVHLVAAAGADGAHVGQSDLPVSEARRILGPDAILGLSVTTPAELDAALPHGEALDYLGLGPMRPTATKPGHAPAQGLAALARLATRSPWPTCAIGGVSAADAPALRAAGIDGMAVVSAICGRPDVGAAARDLRRAWSQSAPPDPTQERRPR